MIVSEYFKQNANADRYKDFFRVVLRKSQEGQRVRVHQSNPRLLTTDAHINGPELGIFEYAISIQDQPVLSALQGLDGSSAWIGALVCLSCFETCLQASNRGRPDGHPLFSSQQPSTTMVQRAKTKYFRLGSPVFYSDWAPGSD